MGLPRQLFFCAWASTNTIKFPKKVDFTVIYHKIDENWIFYGSPQLQKLVAGLGLLALHLAEEHKDGDGH